MGQAVSIEIDGEVAVLTMQNPPVNALGASLRKALAKALETVLATPSVKAVVLAGAGRDFCVGADISEFGKPYEAPWVPELCNALEASPKPVIAELRGHVLGGGFELALACHYRIAEIGARIGLPEVTLGLLPGAGGTQRAPRLGGTTAIEMMVTGTPLVAGSEAARPFLDLAVKTGLRRASLVLARRIVAEGRAPRRTREVTDGLRDAVGYQSEIAAWRERLSKRPEKAPLEALRCAEAAALLPFDVGLEFERAAFDSLVASDQSRALRHVFLAEKQAARRARPKGTQARAVELVGVIGGGSRGVGLAVASLLAGRVVVLVERDRAGLVRAKTRLEAALDRLMRKGRLSGERRAELETRVHLKTDMVALAEVDLVVEAAGHDAAMRAQIFAQLDGVTRDGAVLASLSPLAEIDALAARTGCPEDVIGFHIPAPTQISPLVELAVGQRTSGETVATAADFARKMGKTPVRVAAGRGLIGTRLMAARQQAMDCLVEDGAAPEAVDKALRGWGWRQGAYQAADLAGLDRVAERQAAYEAMLPEQARRTSLQARLIVAGRLGRKTTRGWYRYGDPMAEAEPDPEVAEMLRVARAEAGLIARTVPGEEVQRRALAAMANEGARLLREGVAQSPGDIDAVMVLGFGFPRWRGGPMMAAELAGLLHLRNEMRGYAQDDPVFWTPEPIFDELIKNGQGFSALS